MFLTGQLFPRPWDEPENPDLFVKDQQFYNSSGTILNNWDNPHRSCKKIRTFYHNKEKSFKETTYKDDEIIKMDDDEKEQLRKLVLQRMRYQSQERTENRKLERQALQYKSRQALTNPESIEVIASNEPMLFEELSLRRSNNYKDPAKPLTAYSSGTNWNKYPTKQLGKVITPKILKMDREGCENIRKRIEYEQAIEQMLNGTSQQYIGEDGPQSWVQQNRSKIRQKFLHRREENKNKELRPLVRKTKTSSETRNRPLTYYNEGPVISNHPVKDYSTNKRGVFVNDMDDLRNNKIVGSTLENSPDERNFMQISKRTEVGEAYSSLRPAAEQEDSKTIDRRNVEDIQEIYSDEEERKETDKLYEEMDNQQRIYNEHPEEDYYEEVMNGPSQEIQGARRKASNDFRVSTAKTRHQRRNLTTERLAQPKRHQPVTNPFLYADFRGMIHADYQEALENLDVNVPYASSLTVNNRGFASQDPSQT